MSEYIYQAIFQNICQNIGQKLFQYMNKNRSMGASIFVSMFCRTVGWHFMSRKWVRKWMDWSGVIKHG